MPVCLEHQSIFSIFHSFICTGVWDEKRLETRKPLERKNKKKQNQQQQPVQPPPPPVSTSTAAVVQQELIPKLNKEQEELIKNLEKAKEEARGTNFTYKVSISDRGEHNKTFSQNKQKSRTWKGQKK